ncbi:MULTISPECIES: bifunctional phosphoribosyl-AMP cyclohydrolase/phosphoribosyl-ATP diphosphatase HisIE [unclassified Aliivibrio]|jgi:phosphoribosyl-ATP pyrophosphohydrolase/phosphoribosyl-AMP cyclohydrolase|uniref:bifunctional phosphoribosyl-AMP cyclohydrolase/phosphoribosyl-ATP diphosphatase HisIE n=1 Tax=unclassified Aliivibrio TaxID=2645654 RepID=UPI00080E3FF0|nr:MULTISPECIES: bifunctional phosphoribosyl-AMP cyclohydrolase/phosphoribosyl-ATP diphosphatase HisIE [unclassified Aliivibrio]OCH15556.1 bifunctional phosphoribosyl-AMP cyclohydrolase/phosphoribosyl-ATP diphosphatase [Aliivibrio sp. 1S128]OCH18161.1 bifunctional phosphoribosyl-AMP cyclohydrolase/phosphoribosyl-ATP diphosphatase [Aliivibrio sp. 1S165]OCH35538.1 bifunctional phosphoribosyl-AMP cyclohydrolase/phosphoribosyl-ATP diphosphatase [Aliivibrio sp. 1S175]
MSQQELATRIDWEKVDGLVPAIIQDFGSSQVLMMGYMNQEALAKTLETEKVTFFSRTKNRLWTKGEESGNSLNLVNISLDCDNDTLLIKVNPVGPTCHTGTTTCWDGDKTEETQLVWLHQLEQLLAERKNADPDSSYTASLYARGTKRISQKVGEEGVEVALAATSGDKAELVCESADLMYHLFVLLQDQGLSFDDVINKLKERHK